jgi:hypothetical protein
MLKLVFKSVVVSLYFAVGAMAVLNIVLVPPLLLKLALSALLALLVMDFRNFLRS